MDLQLSDKICLGTGASTGIGSATAVALAAEGARVVVAARSLAALSNCIGAYSDGWRYRSHAAGGGFQRGHRSRAAGRCRLGRGGPGRRVGQQRRRFPPHVDFRRLGSLGGNVPAQFRRHAAFGRDLAPAMAVRGWGRVINVTGVLIGKSVIAAGPAKAELESWAKATAGTFAARGVTVNCVAPGRVNSRQILERLPMPMLRTL